MTLSEFLDCLFADGRVRVARPAAIPEAELREADRVLSAFEREYRRELPGMPPPVHRARRSLGGRDALSGLPVRRLSRHGRGGDGGDAGRRLPRRRPADRSTTAWTSRFAILPDLAKLARVPRRGTRSWRHLAGWAVRVAAFVGRHGRRRTGPNRPLGRAIPACWGCMSTA